MRGNDTIGAVIPALDEERAIGRVLDALPDWVDEVIVVDNGSRDATAAIARGRGARVVAEPARGYGAACLAGIAALDGAEVVVFLDADFSDHAEEMDRLVDPIVAGEADLVIGSRVLGHSEPGALTAQQRIGNRVACALMRAFWGARYTDLGPFRAIRRDALARLAMRDRDFGWTVEMQIEAVRLGLRVREAPVSYRRRVGVSKISGTLSGTLRAGLKIVYVILRAALAPRRAMPKAGAGQAASRSRDERLSM